MKRTRKASILGCAVRAAVLASVMGVMAATSAVAAPIHGKVLGGGTPLAGSTVTLWAAGTDSPKSLARATTAADGSFALTDPKAPMRAPAST